MEVTHKRKNKSKRILDSTYPVREVTEGTRGKLYRLTMTKAWLQYENFNIAVVTAVPAVVVTSAACWSTFYKLARYYMEGIGML
eukprot:6197834-Pleurochrysis_carterae.AAC.4